MGLRALRAGGRDKDRVQGEVEGQESRSGRWEPLGEGSLSTRRRLW